MTHIKHAGRRQEDTGGLPSTDDKTAMGMINGVVLDVDVFTRTGCNTGSTCATLHADTVITCIYHVVDDEYVLAA